MLDLSLDAVDGRADLRRFVDVPWQLAPLREDPRWVPPLRMSVLDAADPARNPLFEGDAEIRHWIARRGSRPVGRIAAIKNHRHNRYHNDRVGFFGFFECDDDPAAADALLGKSREWLEERHLDSLLGPTSPSTNYETGVLVSGFDERNYFMTPWNPPYYGSLLEGVGLTKAKDLVGLEIPMDRVTIPDRLGRIARIARDRTGIEIREVQRGRFDEDLDLIWQVYNAAWSDNWGFVPMDRGEFDHVSGDLRHLFVSHYALVALVDGEPVGFALVLPDYGEALKRIGSGRLFPFGWWHLLRARTRVRYGRFMALGIREGFRRRGLFALFAVEFIQRGLNQEAIAGEASWILEDNDALLGPLAEELGLTESRRWRVYESPLGAAA